MNSDKLDKLFGEIRNEATETSVQEVGKWIAVSAASLGLFGLLSKFKLSILLTKKLIIMTSIVTTLGIATTVILMSSSGNADGIQNEGTVSTPATISREMIVKEPVKADLPLQLETKKVSTNQSEPISEELGLLPTQEIQGSQMPAVPQTPPAMPFKAKQKEFEGIERSLGEFQKLKVGGVFQVFITQGESESITLKTTEEIAAQVETTISNGTLEISLGKRAKNVGGLQLYLTVTELTEINVSGASQVKTLDLLNAPEFKIKADGAASVELELRSDALSIKTNGAASLKLKGTATSVNMDAGGATSIRAYDLKTTYTEIKSTGAANIQCNASENLIISADEASHITYDGTPANLDTKTSISSKVSQKR